MIIHENIVQGSAEWLALRTNYSTASEAPAMMGASKYQTRTDLLKQKKTGIAPEVNAATQRLFDQGHASEAGARAMAEKIIGEDLFPVTASEGPYLASFDGLTMLEDTAWEHKLWSEELARRVQENDLDDHYKWQMDQQVMVSGATRVLFMTSDGTEDKCAWCWYERDEARIEALKRGWAQFDADLATFEVVEEAPVVVGRTMEDLPALRIEVTGMVTASNLEKFKETALAVIGSIKTELNNDQDFADAEKTVKWCGDVESRLEAAKQHALSQTATIDELFRALDLIGEEARATRLKLSKLVAARKESIKVEIKQKADADLTAHVAALNKRLEPVSLPSDKCVADFAGAMKNKRTISSLRDGVDSELARVKIATNALADHIDANLKSLRELAVNHKFLFSDTRQLVLKDNEDLVILIKSRITEHDLAEAARLEAERETIRQQEAEKLRKEQEAKDAQAAKDKAAQEALDAKAVSDKADRDAQELRESQAKVVVEQASANTQPGTPEPQGNTVQAADVEVATITTPADPVAPRAAPVRSAEKAVPLVTIPASEYERLKADATMLEALRAAGVDSWEGYSDAMAMLEEDALA